MRKEKVYSSGAGHHCTGLYTLCFIEQNGRYLLLRRNYPPNQGYLNGLGGKIQWGETPEMAMLREVREESGVELLQWQFKGTLRFVDEEQRKDYLVFCWFGGRYSGAVAAESREGELVWVECDKLHDVLVVPNIRVFLPILKGSRYPLNMVFCHQDSRNYFEYYYLDERGKKIRGDSSDLKPAGSVLA